MTARTIGPMGRSRRELRHDTRLATAWVRSRRSIAPSLGGTWWTRGDAPPRPRAASGGPFLVMLTSESSPALAELVAQAIRGARVYVLASSGWSLEDPTTLGRAKILIRRVAEVPVSATLGADGAVVWAGAVAGGAAPWRLTLDDEQALALRQLFLRSFWHDAIDEAWLDDRGVIFRAPAERPFDVPETSRSVKIRLATDDVASGGPHVDQYVLRNDGPPPSEGIRRLWARPGGLDHDALARLVRDGTEVVWDDRDLPDLITDGRSGTVVLPGARDHLCIELSEAQATEAMALLDEPAPWSFRLEVRLGDHASDDAELWLDGAPSPRPVEPEQLIELPDVQATEIAELGDAEPSSWIPPHPLSLVAQYRWTALPPRVPKTATDDPLVARWQEIDQRWSSRLEKLQASLDGAREHRGGLGGLVARLAGALRGFERTHDDLAAELTALARQAPSGAGPRGAASLLGRLADQEAKATRLQADQEQAEHEALEAEEREQHRAAWREKVDGARRDLPGTRTELDRREAEHRSLEDQLEQIQREIGSADKKARKDLNARRHKLSDERTRVERALGRLRDEVAKLKHQIEEPFTFTPKPRPKRTGRKQRAKFVPAQAKPPVVDVPEEALPEVGRLRNQGGQRYLVIDTWEELEAGEQAARRLGARLVAPEET